MAVKAKINNSVSRVLGCKERDVWICNIGENVGFEEDGKGNDFSRPVLILKVYNRHFCHVVPLSTTKKRGKYYYPFDSHTNRESVALLSQVRPVDAARLRNKIGYADGADFEAIRRGVREALGL
ncbi:MAG: type II toxin-antitoxin system PemK/MazF family toxin [Eggerthellaceae bacterium]|nr:type II toxin-antitoxin system PemK/MazF family toxin [Eggerthellaceae bacterium]